MKPQTKHVTAVITAEGPTRELKAEVTYIGITTFEPIHHGSALTYTPNTEYTPQDIDYLTDELTEEEQAILDNKIQEGPYE